MYLDLESYADYITAYKTFMFDVAKIVATNLASTVTDEDIMKDVESAFEFERSIALIMTPDSERRNSTAMYNPMTLAELKGVYTWFDWDTYFNTIFTSANITISDAERMIVVQPDYFEASGSLEVEREAIGKDLTISHYFIIFSSFSKLLWVPHVDVFCWRSHPGDERRSLEVSINNIRHRNPGSQVADLPE